MPSGKVDELGALTTLGLFQKSQAMRLSMVFARNWATSSGGSKNDDLRDHHRFIGTVMRLEPPQLFRGRGEHPKQGLLKKRTFPESCSAKISSKKITSSVARCHR